LTTTLGPSRRDVNHLVEVTARRPGCPPVSGANLAIASGVTGVNRLTYVSHLLDLDVPVRSVRGRHGGYRPAPGYRLPPLTFTDGEALAVLLGLVAGRRADLLASADAAADGAAAKPRRVLPAALGRRLDALLATVDFMAPARPEAVTTETGVLLLLAAASGSGCRDAAGVDGDDGWRRWPATVGVRMQVEPARR